MTAVICSECGEHDDAHYIAETRDDMIARQLCFSCRFWFYHVANGNDPQVVRAGGRHYMIGAEDAGRYARGFGGARFHFQRLDGTEVISTNVWFQGVIPERFRDRLPDNARLVAS